MKIFFAPTFYSVASRLKRLRCESFYLGDGLFLISSVFSSSSIKLTTLSMPFFFLTGSPFFLSEEFYLKIVFMPIFGSDYSFSLWMF